MIYEKQWHFYKEKLHKNGKKIQKKVETEAKFWFPLLVHKQGLKL